MRALLGSLRPDAFTLSLLATVALATALPAQGAVAAALGWVTTVGIGVLFFLHGARLSRQAIVDGAAHWRLHLAVLASTFVLFPLLGELLGLASPALVRPPIAAGLLFVCLLPSTVQSSIAFTSVAGGNIPAAVCSASLSNVLGVFVTPLLVSLLLAPGPEAAAAGGGRARAVVRVVLELLVPFVLGHLSRPLTGRWVDAHRALLSYVDRGSIVLVVYTAFSAAVVEGLWRLLSGRDLATVLAGASLLLAAVLSLTTWGARRLGLSRPDEITLVFCGSKKSLASGVPLAGVLFPAASVGVMLVPLMVFHQLQLLVCTVLARRYAARGPAADPAPPVEPPAPVGRDG